MNRMQEGTKSPAMDGFHEQVGTVREDLRELGHLTKEAAKERMSQVRDVASGYFDQSKKKIADVGKHAGDYVRQQPVKSLAMAAGAGILLGYLLSRRR